MENLVRIALVSIPVSIVIYFGAALVLTFLPEPTFAVVPFPVEKAAPADFTPQGFIMQDGETLFSRQFPSESDVTILLLHGVTSESVALSVSAQMLRQVTGAQVVVLDLRGHGQSGGIVGDVDYIGQYEDDVADVITAILSDRPNDHIILAGHSMGGGIALRYAQLAGVPSVDGYLLFAPHLGTNAPTMPKPDPETAEIAAAYTQLHIPRLIGLSMLNRVGIKALNHKDTLFFNRTDDVTHIYSYRAMVNAAPAEHAPALSAVDAPMLVVVGRNDEAFVADRFPAVVEEYSDGQVHIIDGESHYSIVESTTAMEIIERWLGEVLHR
jgi:alpha-beta hydrolase superfamily lysophospholipase